MGGCLMPASVSQLILSIFVLFAAYGFFKLFQLITSDISSPIRDLPGPPSKSFLFGNMIEMKAQDGTLEKYIAKYGDTIKYWDMLGVTRLCTVDLKAVNYVLMHSNDYQKPEPVSYHLQRIVGQGLLVVEGDVHKQRRKILNPAFGPLQIRPLTEIFVDKAIQLRDVWNSKIQKQSKSKNAATVDAMSWLNRVTLDIVGCAGFDYDFQALHDEHSKNELHRAFDTMYHAILNFELIHIIRSLVPLLRFLPSPGDSKLKQAKDTVFRIGGTLMERSKKNAIAYGKSNTDRDILSLLTRANMNPDVTTNQRMSDEDVLSQIPTFMLAGHETITTGTAWALYSIARHKDMQSKLREELLSIPTDNPSMDELNGLHYLDNIVRESLRLHPPVPETLRVAMKDDYLPLSKPFKDRNGVLRHEIRGFNHKLRGFLDNEPTHRLTVAWCPSHSDITGNERADELAKEANDLTWSSPIGTTRANAIRRAKDRTQKEWRRRWLDTPKTGGFAISNRLPPITRQTKRFTETPREVFGRLIQCRTGHAYTGEFRSRFFPEKEVNCPCGEELQTRHHILTICPKYTTQRVHLQKFSRDVFLPEVLGTDQGIRALTMFLATSGAFTLLGDERGEQQNPVYDDEPNVDEEEEDGP